MAKVKEPSLRLEPPVAAVVPQEDDPHEWQREVAEEYRADAVKGVAVAQYNLAAMYESGLGVAKDLIEAYRWYSLAGETGRRDRLAKTMSSEQIEEAKARIAATPIPPSLVGR